MAYMSEEGYNKLLADLKQLETIERPKIVAAIAEARDKGDLSENAEYDAAKEAQGLLEMKINKLKQVIADAKIIDESKLKTDSVQILNKVELKNVKNGMKMTYTIVSESEANLKEGKISAAQAEWAKQYALSDKKGFKSFLEKAPVVVNMEKMDLKDAPEKKDSQDVDMEILKNMGISEEDYKNYYKQEEK